MVGWRELIIVLVIVLLVFGTKRLGNIGADLGNAIKGFKPVLAFCLGIIFDTTWDHF